MVVIPVFQNVSSKFEIDIELEPSTIYRLYFRFSGRENAWYMDIGDQDGVTIITGLKLVPNYSLLKQYIAVTNIPPGEFFLTDLDEDPATGPLDYDTFGERYQLLYYTAAELTSGTVS